MTYIPIKPDAGPSPKIDVVQLRTNFSQFATLFNVNHTALNDPNQGNHEKVYLTLQSIDPGVTEDLNVLYCKNSPSNAGTQPQLFVQIPKFLPNQNDTTDSPNTPMQLTYNAVNVAGPQYQSFLAGGYLIYFGSTSNIAVNITLSPAPTKILFAGATANNLRVVPPLQPFSVATQILSSSTFQIQSNATGVYTFGWVAIAQA